MKPVALCPPSYPISPTSMKAKLCVRRCGEQAREIPLERFPLVVGRGIDCDVLLEDRWVSRRHCQIEEQQGMLVVRDLSSRHGTLLNGTPITEAVLRPGDILSVGLLALVADYETAARPCVAEAVASAS